MKVDSDLIMSLAKSGEFIVSVDTVYQMQHSDLERSLSVVAQFLAHCSAIIEAKKEQERIAHEEYLKKREARLAPKREAARQKAKAKREAAKAAKETKENTDGTKNSD